MHVLLDSIIKWTNENSGFLSLILFLFTLFIGWISGLYSALTNRSKIKIEILKRPAACMVEKINNSYFRASFGLYLKVVNTGYSPVDIDSIFLSYQTKVKSWSEKLSLTICKDVFFEVLDKDRKKILPFLMQKNLTVEIDSGTYLNRGQQKLGIVYFESEQLAESQVPLFNEDFKIKIKLFVVDTLGKSYSVDGFVFLIKPEVLREQICSEFGKTKNK